MVQVRKDLLVQSDGSARVEEWLLSLQDNFEKSDLERISRACEMAAAHEVSGKDIDHSWGASYSTYSTGLEMAQILQDLSLDADSITAALLYRSVREKALKLDLVRKAFGDVVADLIDGVAKMAAIGDSRATDGERVLGQSKAQTETVRKMLIAMIDDVRVALIKLAERTSAIRAVKKLPERRLKVAQEVFEIYAPLAHRLGIGHIKWELEDLSFRYLHEESYMRIAKLLDERRLDRQQYIDSAVSTLEQEIDNVGIESQVTGRAKHIYSIWRKMQRKNIQFSQVYDIRAVRILVPKIQDCYTVLGIVHSSWRNIPNEFDDYIATPKENGYRSLHTAVVGPDAKVLEIQIRTFDMHEEAEFGVCAHWRYKGTDKDGSASSYEDKISWLRQVLDWHEETGGIGSIAEQLSVDVADNRIYVFTPDSHVVELAKGATPLDFAYHVHTEIGHRCRGAKVNGRIVPLTYTLDIGDQVEIITSKEASPSRDWLRPGLAYLATSRARAKVRHWFKLQDKDKNIEAGRAVIERELRRLGILNPDLESLAKKVNYHSAEDMYAAIGAGDLGTGHVLHTAQVLFEQNAEKQIDLLPSWRAEAKPKTGDDITIHGVGNLMTNIANCCKPVPGDAIMGYITVGRGVSIHRQDCSNVLALNESEPERIIEVHWGGDDSSHYPVDIEIEAYDRHGLLRDITNLLANERVNVQGVNTYSNKIQHTAEMRLTIEVSSFDVLSHLLVKISHLPNIISVSRARDA